MEEGKVYNKGGDWYSMVRWQFTLNHLPLPGFVTWSKLRK